MDRSGRTVRFFSMSKHPMCPQFPFFFEISVPASLYPLNSLSGDLLLPCVQISQVSLYPCMTVHDGGFTSASLTLQNPNLVLPSRTQQLTPPLYPRQTLYLPNDRPATSIPFFPLVCD